MRRLLFSWWCALAGHKHRSVGFVQVKGWRRAVLVTCDRCGTLWRGVKP